MAQTQDLSKMMQDMMKAFPMDTSAMQDAFRNSAALGEKMTRVALDAAEKSTEISSNWTRETLAKFGAVATAKEEPQDYSKAMTDFASQSAEMAAETLAAFAEVAKKVQMETVELMLSAGKDMTDDAAASMKKATADTADATQRATSDIQGAARTAADDLKSATRATMPKPGSATPV